MAQIEASGKVCVFVALAWRAGAKQQMVVFLNLVLRKTMRIPNHYNDPNAASFTLGR